MQMLKAVTTVTDCPEKELMNGLCQHRTGRLRTENTEKPQMELFFCTGPSVEESLRRSKQDVLCSPKKRCGPTAPMFAEHVTDCRLQLPRDIGHTTVTEMGNVSDIWTMLLN